MKPNKTFSITPQTDPNRLKICHTPTESVWYAYRRHHISAATGQGHSYYHVEDTRGRDVGTANTLSGLLYLLGQAIDSMADMFAGERAHTMGKPEPASADEDSSKSQQQRELAKLEEMGERTDKMIAALMAAMSQGNDSPPAGYATRRAIVQINGSPIETPMFVSMSLLRAQARDAGVLPPGTARLNAKTEDADWLIVPDDAASSEFLQVPHQAQFTYIPPADKA